MLEKFNHNTGEFKSGNIIIKYEIHIYENQYKGISIDILDSNIIMPSVAFSPIDPSLDNIHSFVSNFNPSASSHQLPGYDVLEPAECYVIDEDIFNSGRGYRLSGSYLGNIIFNTPDGKKIACIISQKRQNRYYQFIDLTGTDILACTEWDLSYTYSGYQTPERVKQHEEYLNRLEGMIENLTFTTLIGEDGKEELIGYNGEKVTVEGTKKFRIFEAQILGPLKKAVEFYRLQQSQKKLELDSNSGDEFEQYI